MQKKKSFEERRRPHGNEGLCGSIILKQFLEIQSVNKILVVQERAGNYDFMKKVVWKPVEFL